MLNKFGIDRYIREHADDIANHFDTVLMSDRAFCELHADFIYHPGGNDRPWLEEDLQPEKSRLCSMFVSEKRMLLAHTLKQQIASSYQGKVDLYGGYLQSKRLPTKHHGLASYRFNIAMENCKVSLYYTEHLTDCIAACTVPVYWGSPDIAEIFDMDGIEQMLPAVMKNREILANMESASDKLYRMYVAK